MRNLDAVREELIHIEAQGRRRRLRTALSPPGAEFVLADRKLLNFSSNNYLGLATDPRLVEAARRATLEWGAGSTASRLICGHLALHEELEAQLIEFKGSGVSDAGALVFNSGYHANVGIVSAVTGDGDVIFSDALNHASLIDGCRLSRARTVVYEHADPDDLKRKLAAHAGARRKLIVTDSVFSMDGDLAPLREIVELADRFNAWVMVDEAHATGVLGVRGQGLADALGVADRIELQMGTLGKALGSFGAYVVAPSPFIDLLVNRARSFIFTTALPPAPVAAATEALKIIRQDDSLRLQLLENMRYFGDGLRRLDLMKHKSPSPIFPIILGEEAHTMNVMERLAEQGIFASGIRPPTVAPGTCRLRLTVTAAHTREHLDRALDALEKALKKSMDNE